MEIIHLESYEKPFTVSHLLLSEFLFCSISSVDFLVSFESTPVLQLHWRVMFL